MAKWLGLVICVCFSVGALAPQLSFGCTSDADCTCSGGLPAAKCICTGGFCAPDPNPAKACGFPGACADGSIPELPEGSLPVLMLMAGVAVYTVGKMKGNVFRP